MNYTDILKYSALFVISFIVFYFIYWNIAKHNIIQYYYYSIHNKLFSVYNEKFDYYNIFLVLTFSFIIIIITIVLYWTILYNTAKKKSNCAEILTIIEENAVSKSPYVYSFAIIDKDNIEDKLSYFLLKIRYDFNTRNTKIEYGKDLNGENKLFDKLLLDYNRKLFLHADNNKINKDNTVFQDDDSGKALQEKILSIVNEITIDNYSEKLPEIIQETLFIKIFEGLGLTGSKSEFTGTVAINKKLQDINSDKVALDDIITNINNDDIINKVLVNSWKELSITDDDRTKHTQEHSHGHDFAIVAHHHADITSSHPRAPLHTTHMHTHYISDPTYKDKDNHDDGYEVHDDINIAILTARSYTDVSVSGKPIDYYNNKLFNKNSYFFINSKYYVPDKFETDPENLINNKLDKINENLKDIFDFLLDYLGLQLNYPLESVNNYFNMKSRNSNNKKLRYYDLASMKIKIIDGVNIDKIDNDFFKIVSVDKYNKIHKTYTSMKLLDFTRYNATYEKIGEKDDNSLYSSDNIIYNIIYANKNKDKISL